MKVMLTAPSARLSQLHLEVGSGAESEKMDMMDHGSEGHDGQNLASENEGNMKTSTSTSSQSFTPDPQDFGEFAIPSIPSSSTSSKLRQSTSNSESFWTKMKQLRNKSKNSSTMSTSAPTPTPRQSSSQYPNSSQGYADIVSFSTQLINKMEKIQGNVKRCDESENEYFRSPVRVRLSSEMPQTPSSSSSVGFRRNQTLSTEIAKLCSGSNSSWSAFKSDSDNSSCLFANESFLSSADFTDDVFGDADEAKQTLRKSELGFSESRGSIAMQDSLCEDVSVEFYGGKQKSDLITGAALIGSPSKIRHQSSRSVRRVKSISSLRSAVRYSPFKLSPRKLSSQNTKLSSSAARWYKAKTDTCLYELRKEAFREWDPMLDLPKRKLHFDEPDNQSPQVEVEKLANYVTRTDTPESGYASLNSTRQTPDLLRAETPVNRSSQTKTVIPFSTPKCASPAVLAPTQLNTCPIPWLEKFDVISRLHRIEPSIVGHILFYLEPKDLVL